MEPTIEVRGLTPKISLFTIAYDTYRINIENPDYFNEELYKNQGEYGVEYYKYIKEAYSNMNSEMRNRLETIFSEYGDWFLVNLTMDLDDEASVEEILAKVSEEMGAELSEAQRENMDIFFNYFYEEHLNPLIDKKKREIDKLTKRLNKYISDENIDIFEYMEAESGIKFNKDYKGVFYYDLRPIGAFAFDNENLKISTLQPVVDEKILLRTPFHEYSHELFRSFTPSTDFVNISEELKNDKEIVALYDSLGKYAYDWIGWCEENLVNGFSEYLSYKYYNKKTNKPIYVYDLDFCNYLIEKDFDPNVTSLKDISMEFYKSKIAENNN